MGIQRYGWGTDETFGWLAGDRGAAAFADPAPPRRRSLLDQLSAPVERDEDELPQREKRWRPDGRRLLHPLPARTCAECGEPLSPCAKLPVHRKCADRKTLRRYEPKGLKG